LGALARFAQRIATGRLADHRRRGGAVGPTEPARGHLTALLWQRHRYCAHKRYVFSKQMPHSARSVGGPGAFSFFSYLDILSARYFHIHLFRSSTLSAVSFQLIIAKLGDRAARWVVNLLQYTLPIALVLYVGLFARMTNVAEALLIFFVCSAFVCFSMFTASVVELFERS
jgi:hypothetical protein